MYKRTSKGHVLDLVEVAGTRVIARLHKAPRSSKQPFHCTLDVGCTPQETHFLGLILITGLFTLTCAKAYAAIERQKQAVAIGLLLVLLPVKIGLAFVGVNLI